MKVDLDEVIGALKESQNDPAAAIKRLNDEANIRENEAEALRQVAAAIELLAPKQPDDEPSKHAFRATPELIRGKIVQTTPVGTDAVRRVMMEGGVFTAKTMLVELERRGWEPKEAQHPLGAVEAAIDRLFRVKGELERVGRGEYTYKGHPASPTLETLSGRAEP